MFPRESHKEKHVRVMCDILHKDGHSKTVFVNMAVVTAGGKGTEFMTEIDAEASAFTKGRRYLICMIFNIPTIDDDGKAAGGQTGETKYITPDQKKKIESLMVKTDINAKVFLKSMNVEDLAQLPAKSFNYAMKILNARLKNVKRVPGEEG